MISCTLVSGNPGKIIEWRRLIQGALKLQTRAIDLEEMQSFDSAKIVSYKVRAAYEVVGSPVIVEDVSAGLDKLNGLPGPFIKFFEERLGDDALYQLADSTQTGARVSCTIGYYDGQQEIITRGELHGSVVSRRGNGGFGFDKVFMPDGLNKTFAELSAAEKDAISHRRIALQKLLRQLRQL